jgi:uncharacterized protein
MNNPIFLATEFLVLFVALPLLIYYRVLPNFPIAYLVLIGFGAFLFLHFDPTFNSTQLFSVREIRPNLPALLMRDTVFLVLLGLAVRLFASQLLFSLIKSSPAFWALIMVLYPLLSVLPQELLFRAYFFHRYQPLFGSGWTMFIASALAFGFAHIVLGNWVAVALCTIGGLLFSLTYQHSGSLLLACIDHALFGNFIFTIGLGPYFYHGTRS